MNPTDIVKCLVWEGNDLAIMARIQNVAGTNITQATISSASLKVYDVADSNTQVGSTVALTVSSVIFDALQTGNGWSVDSTGYNFRYVVTGATYFPDGGKTYKVEVIFTPSSGSPFPLVVMPKTQEVVGL